MVLIKIFIKLVHKYYEVTCDSCHSLIDFYPYRPSNTELRKSGCKIKIINGKSYIFCCNECYDKYINKNNNKQK